MFNLEHCICLRSEGLLSKLFNLFTLFYFKLIFKMKMLMRNKGKLSIKHLEIFFFKVLKYLKISKFFLFLFFFFWVQTSSLNLVPIHCDFSSLTLSSSFNIPIIFQRVPSSCQGLPWKRNQLPLLCSASALQNSSTFPQQIFLFASHWFYTSLIQ